VLYPGRGEIFRRGGWRFSESGWDDGHLPGDHQGYRGAFSRTLNMMQAIPHRGSCGDRMILLNDLGESDFSAQDDLGEMFLRNTMNSVVNRAWRGFYTVCAQGAIR